MKLDALIVTAIFLLAGLSGTGFAAEANSSDYRITDQVFDIGGRALTSSGRLTDFGYRLDVTITDIAGMARYRNTVACVGYLCFSLQQIKEQNFVTFALSFNITGTNRDAAYADNRGEGIYFPLELNKLFTCVENPYIQNTPVFGLVFAGRQLNYIQMQNSTNTSDLRVSQFEDGNSFVLPVTIGGCSAIGSKLPMTSLTSFVPATNLANAVEIFLSYPFMDMVGNFQRSGQISIVLEKNNTNQIVVDVV